MPAAINIISPAGAFLIASQWGSYMRNGDPGAVFYSFKLNDARPIDEDHRVACIAYTDDCLSKVDPTGSDEDVADHAALSALRDFFVRSPYLDGTPAPSGETLGTLLRPTEGFNSTTQPRQGGPLTDDQTFNSLS